MATCCRAMGVYHIEGFYAWQANPVSDRDWHDANLTDTMFDIHRMSQALLWLPQSCRAGPRPGSALLRKRVARLMAQARHRGHPPAEVPGLHRRGVRCRPAEDLVQRNFNPTEPDRLWVMDVTEHPTGEGKVYLAVVLDAWSRRVVGWSIADHIRSELVRGERRPRDWPSGAGDRQGPDGEPIPTTARDTRRGPSVGVSGRRDCSDPWAPSGTAPNLARWFMHELTSAFESTCRI